MQALRGAAARLGLLTLCACAHAQPYPPPLVAGEFQSLKTRADISPVAQYSIRAGRADRSLVEFQRQSGVRLEVTMGDLTRIWTPAISGRMSPQEALMNLREGTVLAVRLDDGRRIVLGIDAPDTVH